MTENGAKSSDPMISPDKKSGSTSVFGPLLNGASAYFRFCANNHGHNAGVPEYAGSQLLWLASGNSV